MLGQHVLRTTSRQAEISRSKPMKRGVPHLEATPAKRALWESTRVICPESAVLHSVINGWTPSAGSPMVRSVMVKDVGTLYSEFRGIFVSGLLEPRQ